MKPVELQKELKNRGITQNELARELGVSKTFISFLVNGKAVSDRVQRAICRRINRRPEEVFPDYYGRKKANRQFSKPEEPENQENSL